jgi:hypothetical protein
VESSWANREPDAAHTELFSSLVSRPVFSHRRSLVTVEINLNDRAHQYDSISTTITRKNSTVECKSGKSKLQYDLEGPVQAESESIGERRAHVSLWAGSFLLRMRLILSVPPPGALARKRVLSHSPRRHWAFNANRHRVRAVRACSRIRAIYCGSGQFVAHHIRGSGKRFSI